MEKILILHCEVLPAERMTAILKCSLMVSPYKLHLQKQSLTRESLYCHLSQMHTFIL